MKKILLIPIITLLALTGYAQLNNSWIDYSKTYYKFKLAKDTLSRISQPVLAAAGLGTVPAENFQLWRNGKEVRIYTSVPTGILSSGDFIEFWGEMNDGKPDNPLYRNPATQLSDKFSLETDTVTYFLTVNSVGGNLRYIPAINNTAGNTLPADAYFMRRIETNFRNIINRGYAAVLGGTYVYSSSYDIGEGWTTSNIGPCCALSVTLQNINFYAAGPPNSIIYTVSAVGDALLPRELVSKMSGVTIGQKPMPYFNYLKDTIRNLPLSLIVNPTALNVSINGNSSDLNDRVKVSGFSVTYPATFNFNNTKNFYFELKDNALGNYLVITNFNTNGAAPILYDYNNSKRIIGDISTAGQVKFALDPSLDTLRRFNLMSQDVSNINTVSSLGAKTFVNYTNAANQGDYLIISNPVLYNNGSGTNNVDLYRQYRSTVPGGGYNAKVYDIDELNDQFGFGIKKHPAAIRDFIRFASQQFNPAPQYVFIIGRSLSYIDYTTNQSNPVADQLDLVQTFGWPASDILLSSNPGQLIPLIPIGRLGAINGTEVGIYLDKMKEYEQVQQLSSPTIGDKAWMKNMLHTIGGSTESENNEFLGYMNGYKAVVQDTLFGANVETFTKTSVATIEQEQSQRISELFQEGLSYVKYFGHSSANELAINLNYPENYQNTGKYPFMHVSGCTVGNFFTFNTNRVLGYTGMSLSEKYIFLNHKGSIGFLGSTHFGVAPFLNFYNTSYYSEFSRNLYGSSVGKVIQKTIQNLGSSPGTLDPLSRMHMEEITLHGDPALKINSFAKPDYVIEDQLVKFIPNLISVADNHFNIDIKMLNIGKSVRDSMRVTVKQKLPNDTVKILFSQLIPATLYQDSLYLTVPINPITDKGLNRLTVTLDDGNRIDELYEINNEITKDFYIFEDELRPISPYNYSIVNQQNIKFYASTANPLSSTRQYVMEIDTTELFNSALKKVYNVSGVGGVIEFNPSNFSFTDSTVYYWRTSTVPVNNNNIIWNNFSFIYLPNSTAGFNQSHFYQYQKNTYNKVNLAPDRSFKFDTRNIIYNVRTAIYPNSSDGPDYSISNDGILKMEGFYGPGLAPNTEGLRFYVIDTVTQQIWVNTDNGTTGQYGSVRPIPINPTVKPGWYQFKITNTAQRKTVMDFLDSIPVGHYIVLTNCTAPPFTYFPASWRDDTTTLGSGNSLYHKLKANGFSDLDSIHTINRPFVFVYKKGTPGAVLQTISPLPTDKLNVDFYTLGNHLSGDMTSDKFGPALNWNSLHWRGSAVETPSTDSVSVEVYGIDNGGNSSLLATVRPAVDTSLSWINAQTYPYLKLKMLSKDSVNASPHQLRYWRVNGSYIPEGAVAPNVLFSMKDTADQGEIVDFKLAFKNISQTDFADSLTFNFIITDRSNVPHPITVPKGKVLVSGDTLMINFKIDTRNYPGANTIFVEVNPNNDQPEQYHFNNILFKDLFVRADDFNPLLDVTFDGVHILNKDIVSAKPHILINLKDESRFLALSDTSLIKVQVRFPDNSLRTYYFGDSLTFTPANLSTGNNTAVIDFFAQFPDTEADEYYELIVSGRDVVGNSAGAIDYHVEFKVINKPMISNLLNYPNPFTTSTAFVFYITGSEVPQNLRIQVLTVTGKVVKEITKDELGPLHVGRNITEYKWDGTDTYGDKLANGVYLYRVLTNLNGKSLDKFKADGDKTDKYFTKGYGKMVLIR
ncbi:MAG: C25 family cysteine peptidase [Ferruginibacter sp.]